MNPEGSKDPCPFQRCCTNFAPGRNGNCVAEFETILDCWAETETPTVKAPHSSFKA